VAIRVIVEFQAKPGARGELASALDDIMATIGPGIPGFMGSTLYEVLDNPDALIEIAEWDSADAQAAAVEQAMASGVYAPVFELVAAPLKATRIGRHDERV
jgi:quinol monooxygenase YgiN